MVLIIDDEADIRWLLVEVLEAEGIEARAEGPQGAIAALHETEPDIVLLDVGMPSPNGYEILTYIREDARLCVAYVLMVTGRSEIEDIRTGLDSGADDYLTKPFATEDLLARVRRGLKLARETNRRHGSIPLPDHF